MNLPATVQPAPVLPLIVPPDFQPFWRVGESDTDYHGNAEAIGSTSIKYGAIHSPAKFREYYTNGSDNDSESKLLGRLAHKAILEPNFWDLHLVEPDFGDQRYKDNQLQKRAWIEGHFIAYLMREQAWSEENAAAHVKAMEAKALQKAFDLLPIPRVSSVNEKKIKGMAESLALHPDAHQFLTMAGATNEVSGYYRDPETGILIKIRPDLRADHVGVIVDLKTCESAEEEAFAIACGKYGYPASLSLYGDGTEQITGNKIDMWVLIAVEKAPPFECAVYVFEMEKGKAPEAIEYGRKVIRKGLNRISECLATNRWPSRQQQATRLTLPAWTMKGV